jgi:hypothetical protein
MRRLAWALAAVCAGALAFTLWLDHLTWVELTPPLRPPLTPLAQVGSLSSQRCGACHVDIQREWSDSRHAQAFTDPLYQAELELEDKPYFCTHCHAPLVEQQPRTARGVLLAWPRLISLGRDNPRFDASLQSEGVTCVACHQQTDAIAGPYETNVSPHAVRAVPGFGDETLCEGCHTLALTKLGDFKRPLMETVTEWREYRAQGGDKLCVDCHMPRVEPRPAGVGAPARPGRSHRILGPADADFVATAIEVKQLEVTAGSVTLGLYNASGHRVPTAEPHRSVEVTFELFDAQGVVGRASERIERNADTDTLRERSDSTLRPRELRVISIDAHAQRPPAGARVIIDFWLWDPQDAIAVKAGKTAALSRRIFEKEVALP